jgi:hypothetical protein
MTKWMWNPCLDTQHERQLQDYVSHRDGYERLTAWSDIKKDDDLIIAGHGSDTDPNTMSGVDQATGTHYVVDYNWLADAVANGVNNPGLAFQIKLYMCNAAHRVKTASGDKLCFAGQFFSALKAKGYKKVKVAGYHGEIYWAQGLDHKVVCTRKVNPNTLNVNDQAKGLGILFVAKKGYGAARHRREWFTNNPLGTRWL